MSCRATGETGISKSISDVGRMGEGRGGREEGRNVLQEVLETAAMLYLSTDVAQGCRAKAVVWAGRKSSTVAKLKKEGLMQNKKGKVVSKAASAAGKAKHKHISAWTKAVAKAKSELGIVGFCPVGGRTARGKKLYKKAKQLYPRFQS